MENLLHPQRQLSDRTRKQRASFESQGDRQDHFILAGQGGVEQAFQACIQGETRLNLLGELSREGRSWTVRGHDRLPLSKSRSLCNVQPEPNQPLTRVLATPSVLRGFLSRPLRELENSAKSLKLISPQVRNHSGG